MEFGKLNNNLADKVGAKVYLKTVPVSTQAEIDNVLNNPHNTFPTSSGAFGYQILLYVNVDGLSLPGGLNCIYGTAYGSSTSSYGSQFSVGNNGIKYRSCSNNVWTAWQTK